MRLPVYTLRVSSFSRCANTKAAAVAEAGAGAADYADMSVEAGELEIEARLTVSFKIVPR